MSESAGGDIMAREGEICFGCPQAESLGKLAAGEVCRGLIPVRINRKPADVCGRGVEANSLRETAPGSTPAIEGFLRRYKI